MASPVIPSSSWRSVRGIEVVEESLARERIYIADEVFLTGTAAEVTPVRSVDGVAIGKECPGPVTRQLQRDYFGLFDGSTPDELGWLRSVAVPENPAEVMGRGVAEAGMI